MANNIFLSFLRENLLVQLHGHDWINDQNTQNIVIKQRKIHFASWFPFYIFFYCDTFISLIFRHKFDIDSYLATKEYLGHKAFPEKLWINLDFCYFMGITNAFFGIINLFRRPRSAFKIALIKYDSGRIFCNYRKIWIEETTATKLLKIQRRYRKIIILILQFVSTAMTISFIARMESITISNIFIYCFYLPVLEFALQLHFMQIYLYLQLSSKYMKIFLQELLEKLQRYEKKLDASRKYTMRGDYYRRLRYKQRDLQKMMFYLNRFWKPHFSSFYMGFTLLTMYITFCVLTAQSFSESFISAMWAPLLSSYLISITGSAGQLHSLNGKIYKEFTRIEQKLMIKESKRSNERNFFLELRHQATRLEAAKPEFGFYLGFSRIIDSSILYRVCY